MQIKQMSEKHDVYNWNPIVTEDQFILSSMYFNDHLNINYVKEIRFLN
jgi:hypothetical protein